MGAQPKRKTKNSVKSKSLPVMTDEENLKEKEFNKFKLTKITILWTMSSTLDHSVDDSISLNFENQRLSMKTAGERVLYLIPRVSALFSPINEFRQINL